MVSEILGLRCFLPSFKSIGLLVQEKYKKDFQEGSHAAMLPSWISDGNNFNFFDLQVTLMLPTKFQVNWPFSSRDLKEVNTRFSRWPPHQPSWNSDRNAFSYF